MTKGTEWRAILFFSLPLMASSLLQTLYSFVDSVIVGNFVSPTAFGGAPFAQGGLIFAPTKASLV